MMRRLLVLCALVFGLSVISVAQDDKLNEMFGTAEACREYNGQILELSKFFLENSLASETEGVKSLMKAIPQVLVKWAINSSDVMIELDGPAVMFAEKEETVPYMIAYIAASAEYLLEHQQRSLDVSGRVAVVERLLGFYELNKQYTGKSNVLEKYIKARLNGRLKESVIEDFTNK